MKLSALLKELLTIPRTATIFSLQLRLYYKAARVGGVNQNFLKDRFWPKSAVSHMCCLTAAHRIRQ